MARLGNGKESGRRKPRKTAEERRAERELHDRWLDERAQRSQARNDEIASIAGRLSQLGHEAKDDGDDSTASTLWNAASLLDGGR